MMIIKENDVCKDIKLINCFSSKDARGEFTKIFNYEDYKKNNMNIFVKETYYSRSMKDVIRGMHFQLPPYDHEKLVHVVNGSIEDVLLDLRKDSPTYGNIFTYILKDVDNAALYVPKGFAHGFKCLEDNTLMLYQVTSIYDKKHDAGIAYDSIGYDWKIDKPIVSNRDLGFIKFNEFESPF
jgi:dTDP-4-dehydrorhamnose 3,5-epimerase